MFLIAIRRGDTIRSNFMDHPVHVNATNSFTIRENKYVRTRYLNQLRHRKLKTTFLISLILCIPSSSGILNGHTSGFSITRVHYKSLRTFIEISFQRSLYIFSYYLASRIKKKLKTLQDIYDICHDHG